MNLLIPGFLAAAGLIAWPLFLHLLRIEPKRPVPFPTLRFLGREALRDSRRHRLSRWLLLLLRCALIALIAVAFARPFWLLAHSETSRSIVVIVDNSTSMQTAGRRAAVQAWLQPQLDELRPPDRLGVLLLGPEPTWLVPLTRDLGRARAAVEPLPAGFETGRYRPALDLAAAVLAAAPTREKRILLAGDEQALDWQNAELERPLPPGVELGAAPPAPAPRRQAALVALTADRLSGGRVRLDARVRAYTPAADRRTVEFYCGTQPLASAPVALLAGRTAEVQQVFSIPSPDAALALRATLSPGDDLPADDTAYAALPAIDDRSVMLAPDAPDAPVDCVALALASARGGRLAGVRIERLPRRGAWPAPAIAVLRGSGPFQAPSVSALNAFVAAGGPVWIFCDGSPEQAAWLAHLGVTVDAESTAGDAGIGLQDFLLDHPVFAPFSGHDLEPLLEPRFHRAWRLAGDELQPLARWPDRGIAIAVLPTGYGRILIAGFGDTLADSTFPAGPGFVPFVHAATVWLAQTRSNAANRGTVGIPVALAGAGTWTPVLPAPGTPPAPVEDSVIPAAPGVYAFAQPGGASFYAVNLDPAESDLTPWPRPAEISRLISPVPPPALPPQSIAAVTEAAQTVDERNAWWWLLAAAIAVAFAELAVARRTIP